MILCKRVFFVLLVITGILSIAPAFAAKTALPKAPYVANILADLGFENIYVLEGGIAAWNAGGQVIYSANTDQPGQVAPYPKDLKAELKHPKDRGYKEKIDLTAGELSYYDGRDGRPAYVAVNGMIYDITNSRLWRGGGHDPSHGKVEAGKDLTEAMEEDSPHGNKHLKNFPVVGRLVKTLRVKYKEGSRDR